jgi:hypothetical protein
MRSDDSVNDEAYVILRENARQLRFGGEKNLASLSLQSNTFQNEAWHHYRVRRSESAWRSVAPSSHIPPTSHLDVLVDH